MRRLIAAVLLVAHAGALPQCARAADADAPVAFVRVRGREGCAPDPVARVALDLAAVTGSEARARALRASGIAVVEVGARGERAGAALAQFEPEAAAGDEPSTRGTLLWRIDGRLGPGEERRYALVPGGDRGAGAVRVTEKPDGVLVENGRFGIVHPTGRAGGLPSGIRYVASGGRDDALSFNDRLHDGAARKGYMLRNDARPEVRVVARGPLRAVVEVGARYLDPGGAAPPSRPRALYRFAYYDRSPGVEVEIVVSQETAFAWSELHALELHHREPFFPRWVVGPESRAGELGRGAQAGKPAGEGRSERGSGWGALFGRAPGENLALAYPGDVLVHDGVGRYGVYLHGPWIAGWAGTEWRGRATLGIGIDGEGSAPIAGWASGVGCGPRVTLEIPRIEEEYARAMARVKSVLAKWRLRRAIGDARAGRDVAAAGTVIHELCLGAPGEDSEAVDVYRTPDEILVCNGLIGLAFEREGKSARLAGVYDCAGEREMLDRAVRGDGLWRVGVAGPEGKTLWAGENDARARVEMNVSGGVGERSRVVTLRWGDVAVPGAGAAKMSVVARVAVDSGSALSRWRVAVEGASGGVALREVEFPIVAGIDGRDGGDGAESVVIPNGWGVLEEQPRRALRFRGVYPSGTCAMQFAAYGVAGRGLYFAAHDGLAHTKELRLTSDAAAGLLFAWGQPPPDLGVPGAGYLQPYDAVLGVFQGGWYDAARVYRRWALRQPWCALGPVATRDDIPQRFKGLAMWGRTRQMPADAIRDNAAFLDRFRVPLANHWYNWHEIPFDDNYPEYFPARAGFRDAVAEAQRLGVLQMPYINGRLWDTDLPEFASGARAHATKDERGEPHIEMYGSGQRLAVMCPWTAFWRGKVVEIVRRLVEEEGVAGVYIDQVAAAAPRLCLDRSHGHPAGGGCWWVEGYRRMLGEIRGWMLARHPDAFLTTESNAEPYMAHFDGYLMCNSTRDSLVPLFSAVYHDYNLTFGRYAFASDLRRGDAFHMKVGQLFAFGAQLGWIPSDILAEPNRAGAEFLRRLAALRARALPYLAYGEMLRPPELVSPVPVAESEWDVHRRTTRVRFPAVQASAWRAPDGSAAIALVNVLPGDLPVACAFDAGEAGFDAGARLALGEITAAGEREIGTVTASGGRVERLERIPGRDARVFTLRPRAAR